jgi:hypothetical protein
MTASIVLLALAASGAPTALMVELRDGSRVRGDVEAEMLSVSTSYGSVKLKLAEMGSMVTQPDNERISVRMANGDSFLGVPTPSKLELKTSFGKVSIPFTVIVNVRPVPAQPPTPPPAPRPGPAPVNPSGGEPANDTVVPQQVFRCSELKSVTDSGQTTGGSVYVWEATFGSGFSLLLIAATREEGSAAKLAEVAKAVAGCKGSSRTIIGKDAKFVSPTYTTAGPRKGWAVFYPNVSVQ